MSIALAGMLIASQTIAVGFNSVAAAAPATDQDTRPAPGAKSMTSTSPFSKPGLTATPSNAQAAPDRLPVGPSRGIPSAVAPDSAAGAVTDPSRLEKHAAPTSQQDTIIPNQLIVTYKNAAARQQSASVPAAVGASVVKEHQRANTQLLQVSDVANAKRQLSADPNIASVEENRVAYPQYTVTNDPNVPWQWHLFPFGSNRGVNAASYNSSAAWDLTLGSSAPTRIAFLDTGLDWNHPDLAPKGPQGYNFAENNGNWLDCNGHGTATAGTAAAAGNNALGVAGVDTRVQIYEAKIVTGCNRNSDYFTMGWALDTVSQWAGTKTVNISFGGYGYSSYLCQAATNAQNRNVLVVASAGNDNVATPIYPAACPGVVGVGATDSSGARASFSNWGAPDVYVSAPGVNVLTTNLGGGYAYWNGTSFSAPVVAGIASLTWARYGTGFSAATIRSWLRSYAYNPDCGTWNCYTNNHGYGIPDAYWVAI